MCRALVRLPGLFCWGITQISVSLVEETLLMTYLTMGLINHALQVVFKSLNISDSSYASVSKEGGEESPEGRDDPDQPDHLLHHHSGLIFIEDLNLHMSACFPGHEEQVLGKCSLGGKIDFPEPRDNAGTKKGKNE